MQTSAPAPAPGSLNPLAPRRGRVAAGRGMAMVMVMIALTVGTILALTFLASQTTSTAIAHNAARQVQARAAAEDAMAVVLAHLQEDTDWRDGQTHGVWSASQSFGDGAFRVVFEDEDDGDLGDDASEPFLATVEATVDGVMHRLTNRVQPASATASQRLLLVVDFDPPTAIDQEKQSLFESWGYEVTTILEGSSQAEFDTACADVDVAYVSEEVSSSSVSDKLTDQTIGVVTDEQWLADDLLVASSVSSYSADSIDIVDNTHPVTAGFATGTLQIMSTSRKFVTKNGSVAAGAEVLAERVSSSSGVLLVVDAGATLNDSSAAAGRRVVLPYGSKGFTLGDLNDDGRLLLRQAVDWAAGGDGTTFQWHTGFGSDPTAQDDNGDGHNDFVLRSGGTFTGSSLSGGVWTASQTLDTEPQHDFATPTTMNVRMRNTTVGGKGAVAWINVDYAPGNSSFAPIYASLALQNDGTQTLTVTNKDSGGSTTVFEETGLAAGFVEVQLDLDPDADTVGVWVDGAYHGPFDYGTRTPNSGELTDRMATALAWGSTAQFDRFTVTPNATLYDPTGGEPNLVALYEFVEPTPVTPNLISHWKLDEASSGAAFVESGGEVVMEAENYATLTPGVNSMAGDTWNSTTSNSPSGGTALIAEPNDGDNAGLTTDGPRVDYPIRFTTAGTYRVWVRTIGPSDGDNSVHVGLDGVCVTNASGIGLGQSTSSWQWVDDVNSGASNITVSVPSAGDYTFNVWMREDGTLIDKIVLNTSGSQPSGSGPAESPTGGGAAADEVGTSDGAYQTSVTAGAAGFGDGGTAAEFNGSDAYVETPHAADYLLDTGTLSFWFRADDVNGDQGMVTKDAQGYNTGGHFRVVLNGSRLECRLQSTTHSYTLQSASGSVTAGQWHHVAVGFGEGGLRMYLDGVEVDSDGYAGGLGTSSGGTGNPEPWVFGADMEYSATASSSGWTDPFDGRIDDVRLYDQNLDADQVGDLFGGGDPRAVSPPIVEDTAGNGEALDLTIEDPGNVTWISGGGLQINSTTRAVSAGPATGLHTALTGSGTYTVEVEFTPLNLTQHGPAFMAFYGDGLSNRSFAVGQRQQKHNGYARTAFYANGTPEAESGDVLTTARQHLVMTYDGEELRLLRDGATEATTPRDGNLGNWDASGYFALANAVGDDRPWRGTLHRVAIWDGSVDQVQAQNLFNGDPPGPAAEDSEGLTYRVEWIEGP